VRGRRRVATATDTRESKMRAAYIYNESDSAGPWVLLCQGCIEVERHEVGHWEDDSDWRCACCGATADRDPVHPRYIIIDNYSGEVMHDTGHAGDGLTPRDESALDAVRRFDESIGEECDYSYVAERELRRTSASGYHVYEVPMTFPQMPDDGRGEWVERVEEVGVHVGSFECVANDAR
jgi:hypothetical protein